MAPSIQSPTASSALVTPPTTPPFDSLKSPASVTEPSPLPVPSNYILTDIRGQTDSSNTTQQLVDRIVTGLSSKTVKFVKDGKSSKPVTSKYDLLRSIPTLVLYDDKGLDLFDQITYLEEYYLTNAEIQIFNNYADEIIAKCVEDGGILVELGVGSMRKTKFLLEAIVRQNKKVTYYALDLSEQSLVESVKPLAANFPTIDFVGLLGTYDDSLAYISRNVPTHNANGKRITRTILWLGSSIGNLTRTEAAEFLRKIGEDAMSVGDTFLCGVDRRNTPADVKLAYDDPKGVTREFILNGLDHVDRILGGKQIISRKDFEYLSIYNDELGRHEAYYRTLHPVTLSLPGAAAPIELEENELINIEYSVKYSPREITQLVSRARLHHPACWTDPSGRYDLHLFSRPPFTMEGSSSIEKAVEDLKLEDDVTEGTRLEGVPTLPEFEEMWKAWDLVTCGMIDNYLEKPISLRHPYIFYLGHIPAFMDIQLSRRLNQPFTEPQYYTEIFERGIDPDMEDTSKCHPHSAVPDAWPDKEDVLAYRDRVRERAREILRNGGEGCERVLWMSYEHDAMHLETLLYMLVQSPNVKPPPGFVIPPHLFRTNPKIQPLPASAFYPTLTQTTVTLGHHDPEAPDGDLTPQINGWDNERPLRSSALPSAPGKIQDRPVTVWEYHTFLSSLPKDDPSLPSLIPSSWSDFTPSTSIASTATKIKTVFGLVPLRNVPNWCVYASHVQASAYAAKLGARLPTEEELVAIRRTHAEPFSGNVGFRSWHPQDSRKGIVGNGWEWTDTVLEEHEGFESSPLYPGYTSDFFDGKHNVVLGGSWATVPRIAHRDTFRNWYQRGYPYVFATFRCAF
ncbi:hypothetical protein HDU97_007758 [Phlyctochytrium planicorne]|nr:hypothetical protein HDU97_007758 [Phlyctochytrium planicorne]